MKFHVLEDKPKYSQWMQIPEAELQIKEVKSTNKFLIESDFDVLGTTVQQQS